MKDKSMDGSLASVYREMVKYYIREERYEDGYKMCYALLDSKHKDNFSTYIHMDWCLSSLDEVFRQKLPKEFMLEYAVEKWVTVTLIWLWRYKIHSFISTNDLNGTLI